MPVKRGERSGYCRSTPLCVARIGYRTSKRPTYRNFLLSGSLYVDCRKGRRLALMRCYPYLP
jgi:hypothetical protein